MPFLGSTPPANYKTLTKQTITGDNSTAYTLNEAVANANEIEVFVNNVRQNPSVDYTASSRTITFTDPLLSSDSCWLVYQGKAESTSTITNDNYGGAINVNTSAADNSVNVDASGRVLVGTTDYGVGGTTNTGIALNPNGPSAISRSSNPPITLNRTTSDGDIALFRKDGANVGSIGVQNTYLTIGKDDTGIKFQNGVDSIIPWNMSTNESRDDAIDIGFSGNRFQDLYLSGGVYVGGAGSANKLDDYEEGTWTPTNNGDSTGTLQNAYASYVKIGNQVTIQATFLIGTNFTGTFIGGLPFAPTNHPNASTGVHGFCVPRSNSGARYFQLDNDATTLNCKSANLTSSAPTTSDGTFRVFATYLTGF